jgi:hypothetical protein
LQASTSSRRRAPVGRKHSTPRRFKLQVFARIDFLQKVVLFKRFGDAYYLSVGRALNFGIRLAWE